jgi:antitoxin component of MazEF toxin-antitoxin module
MKARVPNRQGDLLLVIPPDPSAAEHLTEDSEVIVHGIDEIAAIDPTAYMTLEEMIQQITPETLHDYVDFGPPVGKEVL